MAAAAQRYGMACVTGSLSDHDIEAAATMLYDAERRREQVRPTAALYPAMTLQDAYRIQQAGIRRRLADGARVVGAKVGLTSRAMQLAMQIDEPDFGLLLDTMLITPDDTVEAARYTDPRLEVELAFRLGEDLRGEDLSVEAVLDASDAVMPALELIAARSYRTDPESGRPRGVLDTVSDNAAAAGVVLGEPFGPRTRDLRWCGAVLERNGGVEETGLAAGVLGHPALAVSWLVRRLADFGLGLEAGQIVLAGSFTRPVAIRAGDRFEADFGDLGRLRCAFR